MIIKPMSLAFAVACLMMVSALPTANAQMAGGTELVTNGPQTDPGDVSPSWSARQNVIDSQRYDRLLQTSRGFGADAPGVWPDHGSATSLQLYR